MAALEPARLSSHGDVRAEEARELHALSSELTASLDRLDAYLAEGPNESFNARMLRIGAGNAWEPQVREIQRIVNTYDLSGFRGSVDALEARLADPALEIAVFGRVKAGKSSLLNRILGHSTLPVGVSPVTEIPTRVVYGATAVGSVEFADAAAEVFALPRLAEFASAQQNPDNKRHVRRLVISLPAALLSEGVVLVDTPGIGLSEDVSAAEETKACITRCDLGLVLIDATSTLTDSDIVLVDALLHAGSEVQVLLTKADLLSQADIAKSLDFVCRQILLRLGTWIPVHVVSGREIGHDRIDSWIEHELRPRLVGCARLADEAMARKLALLRDAVRAALIRRLRATEGDAAIGEPAAREFARLSAEVLAQLDVATHAPPAEVVGLPQQVEAVLDEAAHNAAEIWGEHVIREFDATALIEASVQSRGGVAAAAAIRQLTNLRSMVQANLATLHPTAGDGLPRPSSMPIIDATGGVPAFRMQRPRVAGVAGRMALKLALLHEMRSRGLDECIAGLLRDYEGRLDTWRRAALLELGARFVEAQRATNGMQLRAGASHSDIAEAIRRLDEI